MSSSSTGTLFPSYRLPLAASSSELTHSPASSWGWAGRSPLNSGLPLSSTAEDNTPPLYVAFIGTNVAKAKTRCHKNETIGFHEGDDWTFQVRGGTNGSHGGDDDGSTWFDGQKSDGIRLKFKAPLDADGNAVISLPTTVPTNKRSQRRVTNMTRICLTPGSTVNFRCCAPDTRPDPGTGEFECLFPQDLAALRSEASIWIQAEGDVTIYPPDLPQSEALDEEAVDGIMDTLCKLKPGHFRRRTIMDLIDKESSSGSEKSTDM